MIFQFVLIIQIQNENIVFKIQTNLIFTTTFTRVFDQNVLAEKIAGNERS